MFTLGQIIFIISYIIFCIFIIVIKFHNKNPNDEIFTIGAYFFAILVAIIAIIGWRNTHTSAGAKALKDNQLNLSNEIEREIIITAEDGRQIYYYKGSINIENDYTHNYIQFDTKEGKRYIINYGVQDTVIIIEK